jgi:Flp pilus assembly protein CpaB
MTNKRLLYAAIGLGLVAAVMNLLYLSGAEGGKMKAAKARRQIIAGSTISTADFEEVTISGEVGRLKNVVVPWEDLKAFEQRPIADALQPGDLLLLRSFQLTGEGGLRDAIGPNQRAMSLDVRDEAPAVGYWVRPGDSVDVWAATDLGPILLKEAACVRAIGDSYRGSEGGANRERGYRSVTIVVGVNDVDKLVHNLKLTEGRITLVLRPPGPCDPEARPAHVALPLLTPENVSSQSLTPATPSARR